MSMPSSRQAPVTSFEEFKQRVLALPPEEQDRVLKKAFDLIYEDLDENVWRAMATAIKHGKDNELEGHENFDLNPEVLKKLTHIQDTFRRKDKK